MNKIPLPRPEKLRAILPSAGLSERRATVHTYAETRPAKSHTGADGFEFLFTCTETGTRRRYGFEGAPDGTEVEGDDDEGTPDAGADRRGRPRAALSPVVPTGFNGTGVDS